MNLTPTPNSGARPPGISSTGSLSYLVFCAFASALGGLLFGYDMFVISGAKDLIVRHFGLSSLMEGWFVSCAMVGAVIGCAFAGMASDRFGRKKVLIVAASFLLVCFLGCGSAWSTGSLIFFRWLGGLGVGIASMVCPLYISEISPAHLRGRLVTLFQLAICVGIVAAILVNSGLLAWHDAIQGEAGSGFIHDWVGKEVWRSMLGMGTVPALLFFIVCFVIAESPRWLAEKGRHAEALITLERINGKETAATELDDITKAIAGETGAFSELFRAPLLRPLLMALFLAVVSEASGITTIWNFGPEIIRGQGAELSTGDMTGMVAIAASLSVFTLVAVWLIDRAGRRPLLAWGTVACLMSLLALGTLLGNPASSSVAKVAAAATFVAGFAFSMGPIKWVFMSEVFPTRIRGRAVALTSLAVWAADAVVNQIFPLLRDHCGKSFTFYAFAAVLVPQLYFVWKIMPETKGRSLEEIERSWH